MPRSIAPRPTGATGSRPPTKRCLARRSDTARARCNTRKELSCSPCLISRCRWSDHSGPHGRTRCAVPEIVLTPRYCDKRKRAPHDAAPFKFALRKQCREDTRRLRRIVHFELDRMRGVLEADDLAHLQVDIAVDEVVIEHAADFQEAAILVELLEGLAQRAANGRDLLELRRRQVVQVLVDRG